MLISAGYDAHLEDPLANCRVTDEGFGAMARSMRRLGDELPAQVGAVLEGGYALGALARSVAATLQALGAPAGTNGSAASDGAVPVSPLAQAAIARLAPRWPRLAS